MTPLAVLRWVRRLALLVVLLVVLAYGVTFVAVWRTARQDERPRSDAIVVLGTTQYNGRPSEIFAARLAHARALFQDGVAPRVVTVGGKQPGDRFTEAEAGARWLTARNVAASAVLAVPTGSDTLSSLRAVDRLLDRSGWRRVVLVSDPWHMLRSRRIATDLGLRAAVSPARSGPAVYSRATEIRYIAREAAAYLYYRARRAVRRP